MSKAKTEILGPAISDFLKYEATPLTRVAIDAPQGTKPVHLLVGLSVTGASCWH